MSFSDTLATVAANEYKWWTNGAQTQCSSSKPAGSSRVEKYWLEGLHVSRLTGCSNRAWSAAFICYCMELAGMPESEFPRDQAHHKYIRWAIQNTKDCKPGMTYYGRRGEDYRPKPGDLIAQWRSPAPIPEPSFDNQPEGYYPSHCDIIVSISAAEIQAVGGNIMDQVWTTAFEAEDGYLLDNPRLICIMECTNSSLVSSDGTISEFRQAFNRPGTAP